MSNSEHITWSDLQDDKKYDLNYLVTNGKLYVRAKGKNEEKANLSNFKLFGYKFDKDSEATLYKYVEFYITADDPVNVDGGRKRKTLRRRRRRNTRRRRSTKASR